MRILLLNDYGTATGGAEIATLMLRDGLRELGHDALLLASSARFRDAAIEADLVCLGTTGRFRAVLQTANVPAKRALAAALADFRPDVVHVGMFLTQLSPLILPGLRHIPSVYHAHWVRAICPTGFKVLPNGDRCTRPAGTACLRSGCLPLRDWVPLMGQMRLERHWRHNFDCVVANSDATRGALEAEGFCDVSVIRCGVASRPRRLPLSGPPVALFCGRLTRQKGVHVLLEAWRTVLDRIPHARLGIVGDGPERVRLEADSVPGVLFHGQRSSAQIETIATTAWLQVVPSVGFEPFGLVAAEAMMRGTAVVASDAGGLREIVQPGVSGELVPSGDSAALANAIVAMLLDRGRCEAAGERGRLAAQEQFSRELYVQRFVDLYQSLLARRRGE